MTGTTIRRWSGAARVLAPVSGTRIMVMAVVVLALAAAALPHAAAAEEFGFVDPFGFADARLMGMGYSHVAVWDAPNPLYSNPASFGLSREQLVLTFGAGWGDSAEADNFKFVAVSDVDRGAGAGGFAWGQYKWREGDALFSENTFNYSVGKRFADWGALGMGVRYLRGGATGTRTGAWAEDPEDVPGWRGLAADAGLMLKHSAISFGVIARDVTVTRLAFDDGTTVTVRPSYSAGLSLQPSGRAVLAIDAHRVAPDEGGHEIYTGGFEGWLTPHLALRGGVIVGDGADPEARAYTGGIGLRFGDFEMSYALLTAEEQVKRQCITLTRRF
ncbi:MAG: hypothetical protein QME92_11385 [Bacillota bacterium]|nr:hypothetical protein [Bacillota bacterium]